MGSAVVPAPPSERVISDTPGSLPSHRWATISAGHWSSSSVTGDGDDEFPNHSDGGTPACFDLRSGRAGYIVLRRRHGRRTGLDGIRLSQPGLFGCLSGRA